jgi:hypothetical protein
MLSDVSLFIRTLEFFHTYKQQRINYYYLLDLCNREIYLLTWSVTDPMNKGHASPGWVKITGK